MAAKKQLIVKYKGQEVNLWDFYDAQGHLLVEPGHVWDDNLDLFSRNLTDQKAGDIQQEMPDLSFLHVTGDVNVSSNRGLTDLSKLPRRIDGHLYANQCGYISVEGLPAVGKNLYLIGCPMEHKAYFVGRIAMGGGDHEMLQRYPLEDEIVRENLPVKGKIFTPMGYVRWLDNRQEIECRLRDRAYSQKKYSPEKAKRILKVCSEWFNENDPQSMHLRMHQANEKEERETWALEKEARIAAAAAESARRAEEKAKNEAESEINKAASENHTRNTQGAKDWARRQIEGTPIPKRSIRKEKKKTDTPAVAEGKDLICKIKEVQKGNLVVQMTVQEVSDYVDGIRALKQRIDNYVRKEETESFPTLGKLLELRKVYLCNVVHGNGGAQLPPRILKEVMDVIGYQGNGQRKEAKKKRLKQEMIAARKADMKRVKCMQVSAVVPTQQMPKRENEFKLPRKMKKELIGYIHKLVCLAAVFKGEQSYQVSNLMVNLLAIAQNGNQRK